MCPKRSNAPTEDEGKENCDNSNRSTVDIEGSERIRWNMFKQREEIVAQITSSSLSLESEHKLNNSIIQIVFRRYVIASSQP